jgi:predicted Zn-dependent protease
MIRTLLALTLSLAAVGITGCATDNKVIAQANEQQDQLAPAIITDPQVQAFMDKIGQRIVPNSTRRALARRATPAAVITAGCLKTCSSTW